MVPSALGHDLQRQAVLPESRTRTSRILIEAITGSTISAMRASTPVSVTSLGS
jgi:hypothetical protein